MFPYYWASLTTSAQSLPTPVRCYNRTMILPISYFGYDHRTRLQDKMDPGLLGAFDSKTPHTTTTDASSPSFSLTQLVERHGPLVWNTYWTIYFGTLGGLVVGIQSGYWNPLQFVA